MRKYISLTAFAICCLTLFMTSCKESDDTFDPYSNWQQRNEDYFLSVCDTARSAINSAKTQYGNAWEQHCSWRMYKNAMLDATTAGKTTDSICVYIEKSGTGSGCPLWTDSVRVNYRGWLMQTKDENGATLQTVFDQSFYGTFNEATASPSKLSPSGVVYGFGTALMRMHIGDRWRIYIPNELGYSSTASSTVPAYSTLIFFVNLKAYYRPGTVVPDWQ